MRFCKRLTDIAILQEFELSTDTLRKWSRLPLKRFSWNMSDDCLQIDTLSQINQWTLVDLNLRGNFWENTPPFSIEKLVVIKTLVNLISYEAMGWRRLDSLEKFDSITTSGLDCSWRIRQSTFCT